MILIAYRHGLRAAELVRLQWDNVDFEQGKLHVNRAKNGSPSVHPLAGVELRVLRRLKRESTESPFVFVSERGSPFTTAGFRKMVARLGKAASIPGRCSTISRTRPSSTPSATPSCRRTSSRVSGRTDQHAAGAASSAAFVCFSDASPSHTDGRWCVFAKAYLDPAHQFFRIGSEVGTIHPGGTRRATPRLLGTAE
jgi:hypothetical protein